MKLKYYAFYLLSCCFICHGFTQNKASVDFVIKNLGINVHGHFKSFSVTTKFSDDNTELERIAGTVAVASLETGIETRDEHLLEEDYFNAKTYKELILESTAITKLSETQYKVRANLEIKGITKPITIIVNVVKQASQYKITSRFEINRRDFKLGGSSFVMSKTVKINVEFYQKL